MTTDRDGLPSGPRRVSRDRPERLYVMEAVWPWWQGSATELERLATRIEKRFADHFLSFNDARFDEVTAEARRLGHPEPPEVFVFHSHGVTTARWSGSVTGADLRAEVEARRALVRIIHIQSSAIDRAWPVDVFDRVPLKRPDAVQAVPGASVSWEVETTPQRVEITFQRILPAARLRVIAAGPQACRRLYDEIAPHLEAGARPAVWEPEVVAGLGAAIGLAAADSLLASGILRSGWVVLALLVLGLVGWFAGLVTQRWAFPPLELLEAWERSRWSRLKTRAWGALTLALAVAGIVLAVVLAPPK
jgi:hypothetical protein